MAISLRLATSNFRMEWPVKSRVTKKFLIRHRPSRRGLWGEKPAVLWGGETDLQAEAVTTDEYSLAAGENSPRPSEESFPVTQYLVEIGLVGQGFVGRDGLPEVIRRARLIPTLGRDERESVQVPTQ